MGGRRGVEGQAVPAEGQAVPHYEKCSLLQTGQADGQPPGELREGHNNVIYINDIIDNLNSQAYLFANDMKLYRRIYHDTNYTVVQSNLNKVDEWTRLWLLKVNPDKCKCMTLSINKKANNRKYLNELQKISEEKDIGVVIDSFLKFEFTSC